MWRAPFAASIGILALLSGPRAYFDPSSLILKAAIGDLAYIWAFAYALGGFHILYGMGSLNTRAEAAGCALVAAGASIQAFITLFFLNVSPFLSIWGSASLIVIALASLVRVRHLMKGQILVWIDGSVK